MISIFLSFFLLIYFDSFLNFPVYADDFNIIGDSNFNQYRQTTAISIGDLPLSIESSSGIIYNRNLVVGISTQEILESVSLENLTEMNYWKRVPEIADRVSGPPGTQLDIVYYFSNKAGHSVDVSKVVVPFSRSDLSMGNWLNIALVNEPLPVQRGISVFWDNRNLTKTGLLKEYIGPGVLEDGAKGVYILDSLLISDPIEIVDIQSEEVEGGVKMFVKIKNVGNEMLEDIYLEHHEYSINFTIPALEEINIEYVLENFEELGYFKITNPNLKTECVIYGNPKYNWVLTEAVTVLGFREDGGWVNGAFVSPQQESFCITRIPYTITSPLLEYEKSLDSDNIKEDEILDFVDDDEILEKEEGIYSEGGEVMGITSESDKEYKDNFVLPKTGVVR